MSLQLNGTDGVTFNDGSNQPAAASPIGTKNLIINGDMRIAQRGTSFTGLQNTPTYSIDRMSYRRGGTWTTATFSHTQDTDVPTGQGFNNSLKFSCTATETPTTDQNAYILGIYNEGINFSHLAYGTPNAKTMTLTFWVKSNVTGTYQINFGTTRRLYKTYTIDTADTWEKKTITFAGDTSASIANDTSVGFLILWEAAAGPDVGSGTPTGEWEAPNSTNDAALHQVNLASSTSNYVNITGVQLEVGDTATPFEVMPYDMQLARCQRYYYLHCEGNSRAVANGAMYTASIAYANIKFPVNMRTDPSIEVASATNFRVFAGNGISNPTSVSIWSQGGTTNEYISLSGLSRTQGQACFIDTTDVACKLAFTSEL